MIFMPTNDGIITHQHLLDQELNYTRSILDVHGFGRRAQPYQKVSQGFGNPEISFPVLHVIHDGLPFAMNCLLLAAQCRPAFVPAIHRWSSAPPEKRSPSGRCACGYGLLFSRRYKILEFQTINKTKIPVICRNEFKVGLDGRGCD